MARYTSHDNQSQVSEKEETLVGEMERTRQEERRKMEKDAEEEKQQRGHGEKR